MVKFQSDLNNFSIAQNILELFSNNKSYNLSVERGRVLPDVELCPLCDTPLSKNGYNTCKDRKAKAFGLTLKKGRVICPNAECAFRLNIPQSVFDAWFSDLSNWLEGIILSLKTKKMSAGSIARHIKETF